MLAGSDSSSCQATFCFPAGCHLPTVPLHPPFPPVWDDWKVDNKEHQHQKLVHKKSGLAAAGGMTQQQLIELQHKLFEEARAATLSGPLPSLTLDASVLSGVVPGAPAGDTEPEPAAAAQQPTQGQQAEQHVEQRPQQAQVEPAAGQPRQPVQPADHHQQQQLAPPAGAPSPAQPAQALGEAAGAAPGAAEGSGAEDDSLDDVTVGDVDSELV